ncbi:hypothetical protein [Variovorax sp. KBW07]|nr:hypothetical protein [Variovorax sp. KBW07]
MRGTMNARWQKARKSIMKTFRKVLGGAISVAGAVVIVAQHL